MLTCLRIWNNTLLIMARYYLTRADGSCEIKGVKSLATWGLWLAKQLKQPRPISVTVFTMSFWQLVKQVDTCIMMFFNHLPIEFDLCFTLYYQISVFFANTWTLIVCIGPSSDMITVRMFIFLVLLLKIQLCACTWISWGLILFVIIT